MLLKFNYNSCVFLFQECWVKSRMDLWECSSMLRDKCSKSMAAVKKMGINFVAQTVTQSLLVSWSARKIRGD